MPFKLPPRSSLALALALAALGGGGLLAQESPRPPVQRQPPPRGEPASTPGATPAPVTSVQPLRDPFHSRLLGGPPAGAQQSAARRARGGVAVLGMVRTRRGERRALVQVGDQAHVVRVGDRLALNQGGPNETVEYLEVVAIEDGHLEVRTGRTQWTLR